MTVIKKAAAAVMAALVCTVPAMTVNAADELKINANSTGGYELQIELENISGSYLANIDINVSDLNDGKVKVESFGADGTAASHSSAGSASNEHTADSEHGVSETASDTETVGDSETALVTESAESVSENEGTSIHTIRSIAPGESTTVYVSLAGGSDSEPVKVMPADEIPTYTIWIGLGFAVLLVAAAAVIIKVKSGKNPPKDMASVIIIMLLLTVLVSGDASRVYAAAGTAGHAEQTVSVGGGNVVISVDYTVVPEAIVQSLKSPRRASDTDECNTPQVDSRRLIENSGPMADQNIYIGKNDFMFFGAAIDDYTGKTVINDARLGKLSNMMNDRDEWAKENGIKLYLVIAPNKSTVYPEYVPQKLTAADKTAADAVVEYLASNSTVEVIDLRQTLIDAKSEYGDTMFYKYDTHWNNNGGFVGYSEIMRRINEDVDGAYTLKKSDFNIEEKETYMKDMAYYLGYYSKYTDFGPVYTLKSGMTATIGETAHDGYWGQFRFCSIWDDGYSDALKYIEYENTYNADAPSVYVYRDSFAVSLVHFLKDSFHNSVFNWTYDFNRQEVLDSGADVVIMEVVEKHLYDFINSRTFS